MSTPTVHSSAAAPKKIGRAGLLIRLILFVFFLSLPFLAAGTLNWTQGLIYLGLLLFFIGGSRLIIARKWPDLVRERVRGGELADSKKWDRPLSSIVGLWGLLATWAVSGLNVRYGWSPNGPKIVFVSNRDGKDEIYTMNADGNNSRRLTDTNSTNYMAASSPDGKRIAFVSNRDGNDELYVMNVDGSNQMRLTNNPTQDWQPSWSPDGSQILFCSKRAGSNLDIFVMNADGAHIRQLTNDPGWDFEAIWQP